MYMNYAWWMQQHETLSSIHITSFHSNLISIIYIYIYVYVCVYINVYICIYIYIYIYHHTAKNLPPYRLYFDGYLQESSQFDSLGRKFLNMLTFWLVWKSWGWHHYIGHKCDSSLVEGFFYICIRLVL